MSGWNLILLLGVSAIWLALASALAYLVSAVQPTRATSPARMRARGLEPPRAVRPSGT
jgi:hypothetical protein